VLFLIEAIIDIRKPRMRTITDFWIFLFGIVNIAVKHNGNISSSATFHYCKAYNLTLSILKLTDFI
jgi:hypothetical protein